MWLIKIFSVIYFTAVCAAQDSLDGTNSVTTVPTTTVYVPPKPSLQLLSEWSDVFPSEKVEFKCNIPDSSDWTFTWFRDGASVPQPDPNVLLSAEGSVLTITAETKTYAGSYTCKGQHKTKAVSTDASNSLNLKVKEKPKPNVTQSPNLDKMFPGESITFTCKVEGSSNWKYQWYHNGNKIQGYNNDTYKIVSIDHSNGGGYHCQAERGKDPFLTEKSETKTLQVSDPPKPSLKLKSRWLDVFETEIVELICEVDSIGWTVTWYRDQVKLLGNSFLTLTNDPYEKESELKITSVAQFHKGAYTCKAHLEARNVNSGSSNTIDLKVYGSLPTPTVSKEPGFNQMYVGETVHFTCNVDLATDWEYQWYKDGEVHPNSSLTTNKISIHLDLFDGGNYSCVATRGTIRTEDRQEIQQDVLEIPVPSLRNITEWLDVFPDESVKFSCAMDGGSNWTYTWSIDGKEVQADNVVSIDSNGATLHIKSASAQHEGEYKCKGHLNDRSVSSSVSSGFFLEVYDDKPIVILTQDPDYTVMFPGESVSFSCLLNDSSGWTYMWYKDGKSLGASEEMYTISSVGTTNNGKYKCQAKRGTNEVFTTDSSQDIDLEVKKIPVPSLKNTTQWLDVFPTERVELSCGMDGSSDWIYTWYRDGKKVQANGPDGTTLSISSASASDRGQYNCSAKHKARSVKSTMSSGLTLHVYDTKPTVQLMQNPKHDVMHTGDSVSFSCHINVSSGWEYLWYKGGSKLLESGNNHTITSVLTSHSGSYTCQTKRRNAAFQSDQSQTATLKVEERPQADIILLTGWSEVFSTDSLVLKCGVPENQDTWNYTWYKETQLIDSTPSEKHTVTPQDDPDQSWYTCKGFRNGRPAYSKLSESFKTKNLLLKRRVLLSISGCIFFGIIAVLLGCIVLRVFRKPDNDDDKQEESNLFLTMAQLKDRSDAPCPLVEYITDAALNAPPIEEDENGTICSETTPLPITPQEDQAVTTESKDTTEDNGGLVSFKQ